MSPEDPKPGTSTCAVTESQAFTTEIYDRCPAMRGSTGVDVRPSESDVRAAAGDGHGQAEARSSSSMLEKEENDVAREKSSTLAIGHEIESDQKGRKKHRAKRAKDAKRSKKGENV